jgi:hypothetical protein
MEMNKNFKLEQIINNKGFFFIMVLFIFCTSFSAFGQKTSLEVPTENLLINQNNIVIEAPVKVSTSVINSNVNFILWFMGTKDNMGETYSDDGMYSKKSFMTSGREPNRLLVKTLLKKALNIKSC